MNAAPTVTSVGATSVVDPSGAMSRAVGGERSINAATARRARLTLHDSSKSDSENKKATVAASSHSPIAMAPMTATVMSKFLSGCKRRNAAQPRSDRHSKQDFRRQRRRIFYSGRLHGRLHPLPQLSEHDSDRASSCKY